MPALCDLYDEIWVYGLEALAYELNVAGARVARAFSWFDGRVIDGAGQVMEHGTVLVRDGVIADFGPTLGRPDGAVSIHEDGAVLCPGLVDMRVALRERQMMKHHQAQQQVAQPEVHHRRPDLECRGPRSASPDIRPRV